MGGESGEGDLPGTWWPAIHLQMAMFQLEDGNHQIFMNGKSLENHHFRSFKTGCLELKEDDTKGFPCDS